MQEKVLVVCPSCGHQQREPRSAISSVCKKCGQHLRVQEMLKPGRKTVERTVAQKKITCFDCGTELEVPVSAESTMCKRCSRYVDLKDYRITNAVSKNFKTKGAFVVEPKGYVFNTEAIVGEAVLKGRFLGKLIVEGALTIHSNAEFKGSFKTHKLVIPAASHFGWPDTLQLHSAEIAGELVGNVQAAGVFHLKSGARFFGDLQARDLIVEEGAVMVGQVRIGPAGPSPEP